MSLAEGRAARGLPGATILQIVPALVEGGAARAAVDTSIGLLRSGARVIVAGEDGPLNNELQGLGGEWVRLVNETTNPISLTRNASTIAELVAAERVDLVHALGVGASRSAASALKKRAGVPLVHSYAAGDHDDGQRDKAYGRALARRQPHPRAVGLRRRQDHDGYTRSTTRSSPSSRAASTPMRFDPRAISPERAVVLRRGWKIGRGQRIVLVPGQIDPAKGQLMLVEAARILVNGGLRGVVFVLAGDNRQHFDYARRIAAHAEAHGVAPLIRQVGACPDMPGAYMAADFVVVPQIDPPSFALTAAEAMAMARPVIAANVGALPEIVLAPPQVGENFRTGWLAEPDDPMSFARAMATALAIDPGAYGLIGTRARRMASHLFTPTRVATSTLNLYANLLDGR